MSNIGNKYKSVYHLQNEYVIELSGDYPNFGLLEIKSILEAYGYNYEYQWLDKKRNVIILESNYLAAWLIAWRSAYVKKVSLILGDETTSNLEEIIKDLTRDYRVHLTYRVRNKELRDFITKQYQRLVSKIIYKREPPSRKIKLTLDIFDEILYLLLEIGGNRENINTRNPKYRSYAPASTMDSFISRALVNFSRVLPGETFLDPFAGSGSIAIEASSIGAFTIASDLSFKHLLGLELNKRIFGLDVKILVADATKMPLDDTSIDAIATDPPYGRSATTFKRGLKAVYLGFLKEASRILKKRKYLSFCSPSHFNVEKEIDEFSFKIESKLTMRVHKSLGRDIYVLTLT